MLGCPQGPTTDQEPTTDKGATTERGSATKACDGSSVTPINIKFAKNHMANETTKNGVTGIEVKPSKAKSHIGHLLRFHLIGDSNTKVTISGKKGDEYPGSEWITEAWKKRADKSGTHDDKSSYRFADVCVPDLDIPEGPDGKKTYGYNIVVDGIGTLDPEVTIKR